MKFDETYPVYLKRFGNRKECENPDCKNLTSWRYDLPRADLGRVFFAVCSSRCLDRILEPREQALSQIEKALGWKQI